MQFVIFHGSFGSPKENWFPILNEKLEALGQSVVVPQFPVDNWDTVTKNGPYIVLKIQNLNNWLAVFEKEVLPKLKKGEKMCFIGHSLGPLFILHVIEKFGLQLESAIFVAPFLEKLNVAWQIDLVNKTFYKTNFDWERLKEFIPLSYVLYSGTDPYVDPKYANNFGKKLGSKTIEVKNAGHFNSESTYDPIPLLLKLLYL